MKTWTESACSPNGFPISGILVRSEKIQTARIIHEKYDEINEEALRYKILSLDKMKGHSKIKNEFELFKRRYFATYQETYSLTIDELHKLT